MPWYCLVVPLDAPEVLGRGDVAGQERCKYHVGPGVRARHPKAGRFVWPLERLLAPATRLLDVEKLPQRLRRVVADDPDGPPEVLTEPDRLVEELNALLVASGRAKNLSHQRGAAKSGLNALGVSPRPRCRGHQRIPVCYPAGPVVLFPEHVFLVQTLPGAGSGDPGSERLLAHLRGAVEIAWSTSHRQTLADHGPGHWRQLTIIRLLGKMERLLGGADRLVRVLDPLSSPRVPEQRLDALATLKVWQQFAQIRDCRRIVAKLRSRKTTGESNPRTLLIVHRQRERRVEE